MDITGLTSEEVENKKRLGLSNQIIDTYTPSKAKIIFRNIFNLINIVLTPLIITLISFGLLTEVLAFSTFAIINTIVSAYDELRIKKTT
jgi:cation-transporting P-type ATPase E